MAKTIRPGKHFESYEDVIKYLDKEKRERHLLLGNGFSRAYDENIFSYKSLASFAKKDGSNSITKLFEITNTSNFEEAIHSIDVCLDIVSILKSDTKEIRRELAELSSNAKKSLIEAITCLHPENVFSLTEYQINKCGNFLLPFLSKDYGCSIISTNYDLLLYWVLMRFGDSNPNININDSFSYEVNSFDYGEEFDKDDHELVWSSGKAQNIYYLHGALHLFSSINGIVKERYMENDTEKLLLKRIEKRIARKEYPLFITEGNGESKQKQISKNTYLLNCLSHLRSINGSLVTFGFSFGDSDTHIIDAINMAAHQSAADRLRSVYIGVYNDSDKQHIEQIKNKFNVKINTFDANSADVWGKHNA